MEKTEIDKAVMKLECLRIASGMGLPDKNKVLEMAKTLYEWLSAA